MLVYSLGMRGMETSESAIGFNRRLGICLFLAYSLFYLAFSLMNCFFPSAAQWRPFGGINLTTLWGLLLILAAFVLSVIYGILCRPEGASR